MTKANFDITFSLEGIITITTLDIYTFDRVYHIDNQDLASLVKKLKLAISDVIFTKCDYESGLTFVPVNTITKLLRSTGNINNVKVANTVDYLIKHFK